jgi:hypothetical protein
MFLARQVTLMAADIERPLGDLPAGVLFHATTTTRRFLWVRPAFPVLLMLPVSFKLFL